MNREQANNLIEQLLRAPNSLTVKRYLEDNAQSLDKTFFSVLKEMIRNQKKLTIGRDRYRMTIPKAQRLLVENRMTSAIDNFAVGESRASGRLQALAMIHDYALNLREQRGVTERRSTDSVADTPAMEMQSYSANSQGEEQGTAMEKPQQAVKEYKCSLGEEVSIPFEFEHEGQVKIDSISARFVISDYEPNLEYWAERLHIHEIRMEGRRVKDRKKVLGKRQCSAELRGIIPHEQAFGRYKCVTVRAGSFMNGYVEFGPPQLKGLIIRVVEPSERRFSWR